MSPTHGGFRQDVSLEETVSAFLASIEHRQQAGNNTYVAFIDFETAFPTTFKPLVWVRLADAGVTGHLWQVTRQLYQKVQSRVAHPDIPPDEFFDIPQGLREGSKLSPLLFNLAVNDMEKELTAPPEVTAPPVGVTISGIKGLRHKEIKASIWQYADDVAIAAASPEELKLLLTRLEKYCHKRGLTINYAKSQVMEFTEAAPHPPAQYTIT
jgi:hypothetical protein